MVFINQLITGGTILYSTLSKFILLGPGNVLDVGYCKMRKAAALVQQQEWPCQMTVSKNGGKPHPRFCQSTPLKACCIVPQFWTTARLGKPHGWSSLPSGNETWQLENSPCIDEFPTKTSIHRWFSSYPRLMTPEGISRVRSHRSQPHQAMRWEKRSRRMPRRYRTRIS